MLRIHHLNSYYGQAQILFDLSLQVDLGEVVVLLGRNGVGKSTTLKSIMGLGPRRVGSITFEDHSIHTYPPHRINRLGIGYVPEERRIFPELTVSENLAVGRRHGSDAATLERIYALFPTLKRMRTRLGQYLSGGEQQMLTIARTLMGHPRLLLLDEPSEGLAPIIVQDLIQALGQLNQEGLTLLISEQALDLAQQIGHRAYLLERGQVEASGSITTLLQDEAIRSRLSATQSSAD